MKLALALLIMTSALGAGSVAFAGAPGRNLMPHPEVVGLVAGQMPDSALILIDDDGDEDEDENEGGWLWSSDDDDDDDGEDEDDDCEAGDDDDDCAPATTGNASKAGTAAPPRNGLFTDGTAPVVKSN